MQIYGGITLNILLDENIIGYKEYLEAYGWNVISVDDIGMRQSEDRKIIDYAKEKSMIIVTKDEKLAKVAKVRQVRCIVLDTPMLAKMIDNELRNI